MNERRLGNDRPDMATSDGMHPRLLSDAARETGPKKHVRRFDGTLTAPLLVLAVFILLLAVRAIAPRAFTRDNEYILFTVIQALIFLLPAGIYMRLCRVKLTALRPMPFGLNQILLVIAATLAASSGSLLFEYIVGGYESMADSYTLYGAFAAPSGGALTEIYVVLVYAVLPAFCEELVFRALLCSEYEAYGGSFSAVVLTSAWFAMLHFELRTFAVYFFSGILLALTLYAARSFFAAFAVHLGYNLLSLFGAPVWRTLYDLGGETIYLLAVVLLLLISLFVFCSEGARLYGSYADRALPSDYRLSGIGENINGKKDAGAMSKAATGIVRAFLAPSALLCYLFYIAVMLFIK